MQTTTPVFSRIGRPALGTGLLCLALLLSACGGDDGSSNGTLSPASAGDSGSAINKPSTCATAHCAPAP